MMKRSTHQRRDATLPEVAAFIACAVFGSIALASVSIMLLIGAAS